MQPLYDALAPIADEPVVLNLFPTTSTITNTVSQAATTVAEQATSAATTVKESLPPSAAATYLEGIAADKAPAPVNDTTVPNPDAPDPSTTNAVPVPDAPEPYKVGTNGTLPAEIESTPTKVAETVEKAKDTAASAVAASEATSSTVKGTPPASPTKKAFPGSRSDRAGSISSSTADGTLKRKSRKSIFGKLKEVLTPEKRKREKAGSTSS
jgi:hypothetical protein